MRPRTLTGVWGVFVFCAQLPTATPAAGCPTLSAPFAKAVDFPGSPHPSHFVIKYRSCSSNPRLR